VSDYIDRLNLNPTVPDSADQAKSLVVNLPPSGPSSPIRAHEFTDALSSRNSFSAPGQDSIFYKLIADAGDAMHEELRKLYDLCLATGCFPAAWKHAMVIPLVKDPNKTTEPTHFRPISLVSTLGKLFERILGLRLYYTIRQHLPSQPTAIRIQEEVGHDRQHPPPVPGHA
jgi:hypothetical protein